jgi:signal transduction histidine kinase
LHALLRSICRLLQPQSEERRIRWHLELPTTPLVLPLDAQQLEQALLNIAKNALEAIGSDGNIWVRTTAQPPTLAIENDGLALSPEVNQRLFTPFFSTKRDGQGIGLTLVRDILLGHGFTFQLQTEVNGRTAFRIKLSDNI